jgi:hypothetical protein
MDKKMNIPSYLCDWFVVIMVFVIAAFVKYFVDVYILGIRYIYY